MKTLTIILLPGIMASSVTLPLEMFNAADNIQRGQDRNHHPIKVQLAGRDLTPIQTSAGVQLCPNATLEDIGSPDYLIIPALWRNPLPTLERNRWLVDWLKQKTFTQHTHICAVGTASMFLAESNVLDDLYATTHWFYYDLMRERYPNIDWKREHLITQSEQIFCAGSINSIADLCIHFIKNSYSASVAKRVEMQFSPEIRRAYDAHLFDDSAAITGHSDEIIAAAQEDILLRYCEDIDFTALALSYELSPRTFQRRFKAASHLSALQYQQNIRIQHARELLQSSNLSILEIAASIGYTDASHFSQIFKKHCQQSPKSYRNAVRGKLFKVQT